MKDSDAATKLKEIFPYSISVFLFSSDFHGPVGKVWNKAKLP